MPLAFGVDAAAKVGRELDDDGGKPSEAAFCSANLGMEVLRNASGATDGMGGEPAGRCGPTDAGKFDKLPMVDVGDIEGNA